MMNIDRFVCCLFGGQVAGIRMLDQPYMTDLIEANSMGHEPHLIDIYSASWGPTDDGKTVDGPRNATMRAIVRGVNEVSDKSNEDKSVIAAPASSMQKFLSFHGLCRGEG